MVISKKIERPESYVELQEEYMNDIHLPDFKAADELWDTTLYKPLQEYLGALLDTLESTRSTTFVYIGAGPEAPLLFNKMHKLKIVSRIDNLLLVDISTRFLKKAEEKVRRAYSKLNVKTACIDITGGIGKIFSDDLVALVEESDTLLDLKERINGLTIYTRQDNKSDILVSNSIDIPDNALKVGDIVYSELLATFTGTPAMFKLEKNIVRKFGISVNSQRDWVETKAELQSLWQRYNEIAYLYQLSIMARLVKRDGLLAIATDTEKRFEDPSIVSIFSFIGPTFPAVQTSSLVEIKAEDKGLI